MKRKGSGANTFVTPTKSRRRGTLPRVQNSIAKCRKQKATERINASLQSPTKTVGEAMMPDREITGGVSVELILGEKTTEEKFFIGDCVAVTRLPSDSTEPWDTIEPKEYFWIGKITKMYQRAGPEDEDKDSSSSAPPSSRKSTTSTPSFPPSSSHVSSTSSKRVYKDWVTVQYFTLARDSACLWMPHPKEIFLTQFSKEVRAESIISRVTVHYIPFPPKNLVLENTEFFYRFLYNHPDSYDEDEIEYHPIRYETPKSEFSRSSFSPSPPLPPNHKFRVLDLCCGAGGFSGGLFLGNSQLTPYIGVDINEDTIKTYIHNWRPKAAFCMDIKHFYHLCVWADEIRNENTNKSDGILYPAQSLVTPIVYDDDLQDKLFQPRVKAKPPVHIPVLAKYENYTGFDKIAKVFVESTIRKIALEDGTILDWDSIKNKKDFIPNLAILFDKMGIPRRYEIDITCFGPPCQKVSRANSIYGTRDFQIHPNELQLTALNIAIFLGSKQFIGETVDGAVTMPDNFSDAKGNYVRVFHRTALANNYQSTSYMVQSASFGSPQNRIRIFSHAAFYTEKLPLAPIPTCKNYKGIAKYLHVSSVIWYHCQVKPSPLFPPCPSRATILKDLPPPHVTTYIGEADEDTAFFRQKNPFQPDQAQTEITLHEPFSSLTFPTGQRDKPLDPMSTVKTNGIAPHPIYLRNCTYREIARIHGYPDWTYFFGNPESIKRQMGNSVCPLVAVAISTQVISALYSRPDADDEKSRSKKSIVVISSDEESDDDVDDNDSVDDDDGFDILNEDELRELFEDLQGESRSESSDKDPKNLADDRSDDDIDDGEDVDEDDANSEGGDSDDGNGDRNGDLNEDESNSNELLDSNDSDSQDDQ